MVLTGGIGSGKSAAADMFRSLGVAIIDADEISRALTAAGGAAVQTIAQTFGAQALDATGAMDRAYMRKLVFSDPTAKARLESILHPLVKAQALAELKQQSGPYALYVVPLWFETAGQTFGDLQPPVIVVDCPPETQVERVMRRNNFSPEEVDRIIQSQVSRENRLAQADYVLNNSGSLKELKTQVLALHQRLNQP